MLTPDQRKQLETLLQGKGYHLETGGDSDAEEMDDFVPLYACDKRDRKYIGDKDMPFSIILQNAKNLQASPFLRKTRG